MSAASIEERVGTDRAGSALSLDGRAASADIRERCAAEIEALRRRHPILPGLAVLRVGNDPASVSYARRIVQTFAAAGLPATVIDLPASASRPMLHAELVRLNSLFEYAGVLVQWPMPPHLNLEDVIDVLDPRKDVDGTHPINIGRLALGLDSFVPATPAGGIALLDYYKIPVEGKHAVVVGRSSVVGRPMSQLLLARNATVTIAHSRTQDLPSVVRQGDIVVAATGKAGLIRGDWLKPGCVVLDFGASVIEGKMSGDVDFESAAKVASAITPVPGGTGPMTNAMLLKNTLKAVRRGFAALGIPEGR
jgi:methylenetetrahydrofolate dehydrogenase (NADP+) / methenyltetrahydrofolate cyclohydrolase